MSDDVPAGVGPRFVRSARLWLRAYPRRWRVVRGEEALGLLADLAHPGARRIGTRAALDLLRGGLATRWREHPSLGPWLLYRLFDRRLPAHRAWVRDDLDGPAYQVRQAAIAFTFLVLVVGTWAFVDGGAFELDARTVVAWCVGYGLMIFLRSPAFRRQALEKHLVPRAGEPVRSDSYLRVHVPRRRVRASAGLPWAAASSSVVLATALVAALTAPTTIWARRLAPADGLGLELGSGAPVPRAPVVAVLVLAVAAGAVRAVVAQRRLRRRTDVAQPHRVLVGMSLRTRVLAVLATLALSVLPLLEARGAVSLALGLPIGVVAAVVAPPVVVAWLALRRTARAGEVAFVDVWRLALSGRSPQEDPPVVALVPADAAALGSAPSPHGTEGPSPVAG